MPNEPPSDRKAGPADKRQRGGRSRLGRLSVWLIQNAVRICDAEARQELYWDDIAKEAAEAGVTVRPGEPYGRKVISNTWGDLVKGGRIKSGHHASPGTSRGTDTPAPWGQSGGRGTGRLQPPVPQAPPPPNPAAVRPSNPPAPGPTPPAGPNAMPRVRRFGDEE